MGLDLTNEEFEMFCSRYVFAPICRGVTSKRSTVPALQEQYSSDVLNSIMAQIKKKYEVEAEEEHDPGYSW